jgi:predicted nucleotidyltransferase
MSIHQLLQERREDILRIAAQHGASNVRIFGSVARGETRPDSDVDFLVELEPSRSLLDRVALIQDLEDLLGRKVDVATDRGLRQCLRDRILNEALLL